MIESAVTIYFMHVLDQGSRAMDFCNNIDRDGSVCDVCDDPIAPFYFRYSSMRIDIMAYQRVQIYGDRVTVSAFQPCVDLASGQKINDSEK